MLTQLIVELEQELAESKARTARISDRLQYLRSLLNQLGESA